MSKTTVKDPWCQLAGGYKCFLDRPERSLPNREIIAEIFPQAAFKICRFGGQSKEFYSLAQHVCGVQSWVAANGGTIAEQLQALLHDAAECILGGDIPKPVREKVFGYDGLEDRVLAHIMRTYELPTVIGDLVWDGDVSLLVLEGEHLLEGGPIEDWTNRYVPASTDRDKIQMHAFGLPHFVSWSPSYARDRLVAKLKELTRLHLKDLQQKSVNEIEQ